MIPAYHEPPPSLRRAPPLRRSITTNSPPQNRDAPTRGIVTSSTAPLSATNSVSPLYPLHPQSSLGPSLALPPSTRYRSHSLRRPKDKDDSGKEKHHHRPHLHAHIPGHAYRHREKNFSVPQAALLLGLPPEVDRIWATKDGQGRQAELERMGFGAGLGTGLLGHGVGQDGSGFSGPRKGQSRSVGGTPEGSLTGSRRGSLAREIEREMQRRKKRRVTVEDVQRERQEGMKREEYVLFFSFLSHHDMGGLTIYQRTPHLPQPPRHPLHLLNPQARLHVLLAPRARHHPRRHHPFLPGPLRRHYDRIPPIQDRLNHPDHRDDPRD